MTTATASRVAPEERGRLDLSTTVVERIAQAAAAEIDGVLVERRGLGRSDLAPKATVRLDGSLARLRLRVPLRYPVTAPEAVGRIRDNVVRRLQELADVTVRVCDIEVTALVPEPGGRTVQ